MVSIPRAEASAISSTELEPQSTVTMSETLWPRRTPTAIVFKPCPSSTRSGR